MNTKKWKKIQASFIKAQNRIDCCRFSWIGVVNKPRQMWNFSRYLNPSTLPHENPGLMSQPARWKQKILGRKRGQLQDLDLERLQERGHLVCTLEKEQNGCGC